MLILINNYPTRSWNAMGSHEQLGIIEQNKVGVPARNVWLSEGI